MVYFLRIKWAVKPAFCLGRDFAISNGSQTDLKDRLIELLEPVVLDHGAILVDLELSGSANKQTARLLVHVDTGVTLDLCQAISREAADLLDIENPIPGRYRLEVTSPGLDRPLQTDQDFNRAYSRTLKIVLSTGETVYGRLQGWKDDRIILELVAGAEEIDRQKIVKATVEPEL